MDSNPSVSARLEELERLVTENNKILRTMRRSQRIGRVFSTLYWVLVIGVAVGAFYFIQPYLDSVNESVNGIQNFQDQVINEFTSSVSDSFKR